MLVFSFLTLNLIRLQKLEVVNLRVTFRVGERSRLRVKIDEGVRNTLSKSRGEGDTPSSGHR